MIEREVLNVETSYEPKLLFGLTKHQFIWAGIGTVIGVGTYFLLSTIFVMKFCVIVAVLLTIPFFICGFYRPYGIDFEKFAKMMIKTSILSPSVRLYRSEFLPKNNIVIDEKEKKKLEKQRSEDIKKYGIYK